MGDLLGAEIVEEGLNGRTTDIADPTHPEITGAGLDGAAYLPACLATHLPLDLVIILLGTNDLKAMYARPPLRIALGVARLVEIAKNIGAGVGTPYSGPEVLLVCPPPLGTMTFFTEMFAGGHEKALMLPGLYAQIAALAGTRFMDAGRHIRSDAEDGLHWSAQSQRLLGQAAANMLRSKTDEGARA